MDSKITYHAWFWQPLYWDLPMAFSIADRMKRSGWYILPKLDEFILFRTLHIVGNWKSIGIFKESIGVED